MLGQPYAQQTSNDALSDRITADRGRPRTTSWDSAQQVVNSAAWRCHLSHVAPPRSACPKFQGRSGSSAPVPLVPLRGSTAASTIAGASEPSWARTAGAANPKATAAYAPLICPDSPKTSAEPAPSGALISSSHICTGISTYVFQLGKAALSSPVAARRPFCQATIQLSSASTSTSAPPTAPRMAYCHHDTRYPPVCHDTTSIARGATCQRGIRKCHETVRAAMACPFRYSLHESSPPRISQQDARPCGILLHKVSVQLRFRRQQRAADPVV